jgi:drug/metabolite transporter (DMT)-like permease
VVWHGFGLDQRMQTHAQNPLAGIFWMFVTGLLFVAVTALVKYMGPRIPPAEAAFIRYAVGLVFILPMISTFRTTRLTGRQWRLFTLRGVCHAGGVMLWFFAMTRIPIAEVTAMNYLSPVYVAVGAALFLGETFALRRIVAVVMALLGALLILRPGFRELSPGHIAMLFAAVIFAGSYLTAKLLADELPASIVVAMLSIFVPIVLLPFALADWVWPIALEFGLLCAVACFATAGHYTMTLAFAAAPVTVTQPVTFLQLVWATLLGAVAFSEPVDIWVLIGGAGILSSITYITWREAVVRKKSITPPMPATKT